MPIVRQRDGVREMTGFFVEIKLAAVQNPKEPWLLRRRARRAK